MDAKAAKEGQSETGAFGPSAYLVSLLKKVKPQSMAKVEASETQMVDANPDKDIQALITETPSMNAATFYNLLKSKGFLITPPAKPEVKEADGGNSFPQALRAEAKESAAKMNLGNLSFRSTRFIESAVTPSSGAMGASPESDIVGFTKFRVVLIQEGMGNFRDAYFYSRAALESAIPAFEGRKIYADHPSASDEYNRPERSVRDVLGHFENVHIEEGDAGQALLVGDCVIPPEEPFRWARALMTHAVEFSKKYPDKEFIGLSINANGDAESMPIDKVIESGVPESALAKLNKAKENGIDTIKLVSIISDAVSCDLVTEAGAGGKVLQLLEGDKEMDFKKKEADEEKKDMTAPAGPDQAVEEATPEAPHDDEAQDIELIKKMIAKYMGDSEVSAEECGIVKEAHEACKEMGMEGEEAEKGAVAHLKMAKHMAAKKEAGKVEEAKKDEEEKAEEAAKVEEAAEKKEEEKVKESMISLKAENAKLKESLRKIEIAAHLDKVCRESKLPKAVTTAFRESVETPKSVDEINKAWKLFERGFKSTTAVGESFLEGLFVTPEKQVITETKAGLFDGVFKK